MRVRAWDPGRLSGAGTPFNWPAANGHGRAPFTSFPAGPGSPVAGALGVAISQFGWVDPIAGLVSNQFTAGFFLGFVLPVPELLIPPLRYPMLTYSCGVWTLRPGMRCVIASQGDFVTRFPLGAQVGSQVWTDPATGLPYSSNLTGSYIATRWTAMCSGGCNARIRISSFAAPLN
jgi:hypothetical protein